MLHTKLFCFSLILLFINSCTKTKPVTISDEDIAEVVFLHQMKQISQDPTIRTMPKYFLSLNSYDPSNDLLEKLKAQNVSASPASQSEKKDWVMRNKVTGEWGILLSIDSVERNNDGSIEVELYIYSGPGNSATLYYRVIIKNGKCVITDVRYGIVS